ncbi:hypothetical protein DPEC_G00192290 [Dallia pectoralis]|uniref:Uncharacterized protein n=1 Tax=Dallia pectoralis TaxID=75939 RepID=A0ACC2GCC2_DALPE|nr:hypothetical protein DPEC_G00192290 [Dallia pectoralis]
MSAEEISIPKNILREFVNEKLYLEEIEDALPEDITGDSSFCRPSLRRRLRILLFLDSLLHELSLKHGIFCILSKDTELSPEAHHKHHGGWRQTPADSTYGLLHAH